MASKPFSKKALNPLAPKFDEELKKGPPHAEFIDVQPGLPEHGIADMNLYNIYGEHPQFGSTVTAPTLQELGIPISKDKPEGYVPPAPEPPIQFTAKVTTKPTSEKINFRGLEIVIEWPKGSTRTFDRSDAEIVMKADYGRIDDTKGKDKEEIDVYVNRTDTDEEGQDASHVYKVKQVKKGEDKIDEYKYMLGFRNKEQAEKIYLEHIPKDFFGGIEEMTFDEFAKFIEKNQEKNEVKASLDQKYWIDPSGKEYSIGTEEHWPWIRKMYGDIDAFGDGWIRIGIDYSRSDVYIQCNSLNNIPTFVDTFLSKLNTGSIKFVLVESRSGTPWVRIFLDDAILQGIQKATNKELQNQRLSATLKITAEFLPSFVNAPDNNWQFDEGGPDKEIAVDPDAQSDEETFYAPCTVGKPRNPDMWNQFMATFRKESSSLIAPSVSDYKKHNISPMGFTELAEFQDIAPQEIQDQFDQLLDEDKLEEAYVLLEKYTHPFRMAANQKTALVEFDEKTEQNELGEEETLHDYEMGFKDLNRQDTNRPKTTWDAGPSKAPNQQEPYSPLPVTLDVETNPANEGQNSPGGYPNRFCVKPQSEWYSNEGMVDNILVQMFKNKESALVDLTKEAGNLSTCYTDQQMEDIYNEQHMNNTDEEPYVNHDQRDYPYGMHDSPENTDSGIGWPKDNQPNVVILDKLNKPFDRVFPGGLPTYEVTIFDTYPMSDGMEV